MTTPSRRLPALFLLALSGVLAVLVVAAAALAGPWVATGVAVALAAGVVALLVRAARARAASTPRAHTGCACCGDTPWTGVEVV